MMTGRKAIPSAIRTFVHNRDIHRCVKCGLKIHLHIHHIQPCVMGGTDSPDNLVTLCSTCHDYAPNDPIRFKEYVSMKFPPLTQWSVNMVEIISKMVAIQYGAVNPDDEILLNEIAGYSVKVYNRAWVFYVAIQNCHFENSARGCESEASNEEFYNSMGALSLSMNEMEKASANHDRKLYASIVEKIRKGDLTVFNDLKTNV